MKKLNAAMANKESLSVAWVLSNLTHLESEDRAAIVFTMCMGASLVRDNRKAAVLLTGEYAVGLIEKFIERHGNGPAKEAV